MSRLLAKEPADRPASADEVIGALGSLGSGAPVRSVTAIAVPAHAGVTSAPRLTVASRSAMPIVAAVITLVIAVGIGGVVLLRAGHDDARPVPASAVIERAAPTPSPALAPVATPVIAVTPARIQGTEVTVPSPSPSPTPEPAAVTAPPERVDAWLVTGTQYGSDGGTGNVRQARAGYAGPVIAAIVPTFQTTDGGDLIAFVPEREHIHSGVLAILRVDGKLRGAAGGIGLAIARGHVEGDVLVLRSSVTGGYLGGRHRFLTGFLRPYVGAGVPGFVYDHDAGATKVAIGMRIAAGVEIVVNGHISVQGDVGYEHFFGVANTRFEPDVVVPTVGIIGRL